MSVSENASQPVGLVMFSGNQWLAAWDPQLKETPGGIISIREDMEFISIGFVNYLRVQLGLKMRI